MSTEQDQLIEHALIDTVSTEMTIMKALCDEEFPCDVSTVLAVRMSRAVVATICRLRHQKPLPQSSVSLFTPAVAAQLAEMEEELTVLSLQFENKLSATNNNDQLLISWNA